MDRQWRQRQLEYWCGGAPDGLAPESPEQYKWCAVLSSSDLIIIPTKSVLTLPTLLPFAARGAFPRSRVKQPKGVFLSLQAKLFKVLSTLLGWRAVLLPMLPLLRELQESTGAERRVRTAVIAEVMLFLYFYLV